MRYSYSILFLLTVWATFGRAQSEDRRGLNLAFSIGTAFNDPGTWSFYGGPNHVIVRPGISGNIGIEYGPFSVTSASQLYLCMDVGFTQTKTAEVEFQRNGTEQAKWTAVPILAWVRLTTNSSLSPYVQLGVGLINFRFVESHSIFSDYLDTDLQYWAFGWGGGAGVEWRMSDKIRLSLFVTHLSAEGTRTQPRWDGSLNGIYLRHVITPVGIRFVTTI
jgi:opacity protein-like surface antigen